MHNILIMVSENPQLDGLEFYIIDYFQTLNFTKLLIFTKLLGNGKEHYICKIESERSFCCKTFRIIPIFLLRNVTDCDICDKVSRLDL